MRIPKIVTCHDISNQSYKDIGVAAFENLVLSEMFSVSLESSFLFNVDYVYMFFFQSMKG